MPHQKTSIYFTFEHHASAKCAKRARNALGESSMPAPRSLMPPPPNRHQHQVNKAGNSSSAGGSADSEEDGGEQAQQQPQQQQQQQQQRQKQQVAGLYRPPNYGTVPSNRTPDRQPSFHNTDSILQQWQDGRARKRLGLPNKCAEADTSFHTFFEYEARRVKKIEVQKLCFLKPPDGTLNLSKECHLKVERKESAHAASKFTAARCRLPGQKEDKNWAYNIALKK
eukprot:635417-Pelagomonas_calceolata.AAC.4